MRPATLLFACWLPLLLPLLLPSTSGYVSKKPCPRYGCPLAPPIHEPFVPAPPGHTPRCAKPGLTFCESLDRYPQQLIKFLIEKRSVDIENFLRDESAENFDAFRQMPNYEEGGEEEEDVEDDESGYDYARPKKPPPELYPQSQPLSPPLQPSPQYQPALNASNNRYLPAYSHTSGKPYLSSHSVSVSTQQSYSYQLPSMHAQHHGPGLFGPSLRGPWPRDSPSGGVGYSPHRNPLLELAARHTRGRAKRQAEANAVSICPTRSQFVSPRAALNNQGNWMFVVNLEPQQQQQQQKYSQLVKSEICASETCDGLCALPVGYTSKCQQQYVQKRLVALDGTGDRLYTDVFWFPHGCMCQVMLEY